MFIIVLFLIAAVTAHNEIEDWKTFKLQHGKSYLSSHQENLRYTIFKQNLKKIHQHNEKFRNGEATFEMGINQFADMTTDEFKKFLGYQHSTKPSPYGKIEYFNPDSISEVPDSINWNISGAVTVVKDQGSCGSCWSFSAVGSLEGQYFRKTGNLVSLSAQNLVDCDSTCNGCNGGLMDRAFRYIQKNGIQADEDYPYCGRDESCKANKSSIILKISSYRFVKENNENDLQRAVAAIGPISVAIEVTGVFQFYKSGILYDNTCGNSKYFLNHGVVVVGYGTENGVDYWIVKNSWGTSWGENGYIRMSRNRNNQCGIATEPVYPII